MLQIVIRLLPSDDWREFSFSKSSTVIEIKVRALQYFGILPSFSALSPAPSSSSSSGTSAHPKTAGTAAEKVKDSTIKAKRRSSLLASSEHANSNAPLSQLGASEELLKAAETLSQYCLLHVCGNHYVDESKTLGVACVNYDVLVLQQRRRALNLPLDTFPSPYLRVSCLIQITPNNVSPYSPLGLNDETSQAKPFKTYNLTLFESQLWLKSSFTATDYLQFEMLDLPCTVGPAPFAAGPGSSNLLNMIMRDGTRLKIRTVREEDWETLATCLGPEGSTIQSFDRKAHLLWREEVFRRAQRSNQGLLPPHYEPNDAIVKQRTPKAESAAASKNAASPNATSSPSRKLKYQHSRESGFSERLSMKRSQSDLPKVQPSMDVEGPRVPRRARSFSTPPFQLPISQVEQQQNTVWISSSIPMPIMESRYPNLQLAEIASSPETASSDMPSHHRRQSSTRSVCPSTGEPREGMRLNDPGEERRRTVQEMPKLVARDTGSAVEDRRRIRKWNDPDSDEFSDL